MLISGLLRATAGTLIVQSFFADYGFWTMAEDATVARSAGPTVRELAAADGPAAFDALARGFLPF